MTGIAYLHGGPHDGLKLEPLELREELKFPVLRMPLSEIGGEGELSAALELDISVAVYRKLGDSTDGAIYLYDPEAARSARRAQVTGPPPGGPETAKEGTAS